MKLNFNLQNTCFILIILSVWGISCSAERETARHPDAPRRSIYITPEEANSVNPDSENSNSESNIKMSSTEKTATLTEKNSFYSNLETALNKHSLKRSQICDESNPVEQRILQEYGAVFLTIAEPPPACMFKSENDVNNFQNRIPVASENMNGATIELQAKAMENLLFARKEAQTQGLDITPRDGTEAARRSFDKTLELWKSRFEPACEFWKSKGKLTDEQVNKLKSLPINEQVKEVLELEKEGIYFNKTFSATILSSVAAPGTSQHLSMLAFDAAEFLNPQVRKILGNHGWFRTVKGDAPHFTFLGIKENELTKLGLHRIETKDGEFWVPNV